MKKKILLIDDEVITNRVNQLILENTNLVESIESVNNGYEAIHFLEALIAGKRSLPDTIFVDINMPYMDGFEFLKEIRNHLVVDYVNIHFVMLSSSIDPRDKEKARLLGVVHYLEKPLSIAIAREVLQQTNSLSAHR